MNLTRFSFSNRALVLAIVFVCFVFGAKTFNTMPRREDPEMTIRVALVITEWPGASARKVEDLITDPLETNIKKMDGVDEITSDSRTGLSIITVELDERITEIDQYWDELRNKVGEVIPYLPDGSRSPVVNSDFGDVYAVILALYQIPPPGGDTIQRPYTWRELEEFAETI